MHGAQLENSSSVVGGSPSTAGKIISESTGVAITSLKSVEALLSAQSPCSGITLNLLH